MLLKVCTIILTFLVFDLASKASTRTILDDVDELIQQYQLVLWDVIALIGDNLAFLTDRIYGLGNVAIANSGMTLYMVKNQLIYDFVRLENLGAETGIDVTICTKEPAARVEDLHDTLRDTVSECLNFRMSQADRIIRQMFVNINSGVMPVELYQNRTEDCKRADNVEECVIRVMVQVSTQIEFLPVVVQEGLDDVKETFDELIRSFADCSGSEVTTLLSEGNMILAETRQCVDDMLRESSSA